MNKKFNAIIMLLAVLFSINFIACAMQQSSGGEKSYPPQFPTNANVTYANGTNVTVNVSESGDDGKAVSEKTLGSESTSSSNGSLRSSRSAVGASFSSSTTTITFTSDKTTTLTAHFDEDRLESLDVYTVFSDGVTRSRSIGGGYYPYVTKVTDDHFNYNVYNPVGKSATFDYVKMYFKDVDTLVFEIKVSNVTQDQSFSVIDTLTDGMLLRSYAPDGETADGIYCFEMPIDAFNPMVNSIKASVAETGNDGNQTIAAAMIDFKTGNLSILGTGTEPEGANVQTLVDCVESWNY
jgi:hypothetical protein